MVRSFRAFDPAHPSRTSSNAADLACTQEIGSIKADWVKFQQRYQKSHRLVILASLDAHQMLTPLDSLLIRGSTIIRTKTYVKFRPPKP
jgi:hypothetical protein